MHRADKLAANCCDGGRAQIGAGRLGREGQQHRWPQAAQVAQIIGECFVELATAGGNGEGGVGGVGRKRHGGTCPDCTRQNRHQ